MPKNENWVPKIRKNYKGKELEKLKREISKVKIVEKL